MHHYFFSLVLNYSIVIAAVAGIIRFKYILSDFYPFLSIIFLGLINELISTARIYGSGTNALNSNIYVLMEYLLVLYQFFKWNLYRKRTFILFATAGMILWIIDNIILNSVMQNNSLFRTFYSLVIVVLSTNELSKLVIYEKGVLLKNATFLICITFLIYYGSKACVEAFNAFHLGLSHLILWNLWIIMYFVNALANIFYTIAILCIPRKREFILPY